MKRRQAWLAGGFGLIGMLLTLHHLFCLTITLGDSMRPTFIPGQILLVEKCAYRNENPQRSDIVVAQNHKDLIVKRIVGLPGEEIEVKGGTVYINRNRFDERYLNSPGSIEIRSGKLTEDRYALLGDNRALPVSRQIHAVVSKARIVGKVIWSFRF